MIEKSMLIVIEGDELRTYRLSEKDKWEIGRISKTTVPDIAFSSHSVSRKQGYLQFIDGFWFYIDYYGKNGTVYNTKRLKPGIGSTKKPVCLEDQDTLIFGCGASSSRRTVKNWAFYSMFDPEEGWRNVVTEKCHGNLRVQDGCMLKTFSGIRRGTFIRLDNGLLIYMDDITYLAGNISLL